MVTHKQPLFSMLYNSRFIHNETIYTVTQQATGMTEVHGKGKFWAWPQYDGTNSLKVEAITTHPQRQSV